MLNISAAQGSVDVGVVIPFYRSDRTFPATLASLLAQTRRPAAMVVVDDGTPSGESQTLESLPDAVKLIRLPQNRGIGAARNAGLAAVRTRYVSFLDADDRWPPEFLDLMSRRLEAKPELPAVFARIRRCWPDGRTDIPGAKPARLDLAEAIVRTHSLPSAILFRRDPLVAVGGWPEDRLLLEDWVLTLRLIAHAGPLELVPDVVIDYAVGDSNSLSSRDLQMLRRWWHTLRAVRSVVDGVHGPGAARRRFAQALADRADRNGGVSRRLLHLASRCFGRPLGE